MVVIELLYPLIRPRKIQKVYVKAPLRVMYRKYSRRGGVEWQIQHEAKLSAVFARDPPQVLYLSVHHE